MSSHMSIVGKNDHFKQYTIALHEVNSARRAADRRILEVARRHKEMNEYVQKVGVQMYLMEIMIRNMRKEIHFGLAGKYRDAVLEEMVRTGNTIKDVNNRWEDFRRTFKTS